MKFTIWRFTTERGDSGPVHEVEAHPSTEQDESLEDRSTKIMTTLEANTATSALAKWRMLTYRERE